jgi:hypothetical protein
MVRWIHPGSATWRLCALSLFCAALAAGWFLVFRWLQVPALAYVDVIVYGLTACWAILVAAGRWSAPGDQRRVPGDADKGGKGDGLKT